MNKTIPVYKPGDKYHRSVAIKPPGAAKLIEFVLPEDVADLEPTHYLVYFVDRGSLVDVKATEDLLVAQWLAQSYIFGDEQNAVRH